MIIVQLTDDEYSALAFSAARYECSDAIFSSLVELEEQPGYYQVDPTCQESIYDAFLQADSPFPCLDGCLCSKLGQIVQACESYGDEPITIT